MNTKAFTTTWKPIATVFLLLALLITPLSAFAADTAAATVRNTELSGSLADSNTRHYLSVEPSERDGEVTLTLTFGPQDDGRIANKVNFWVLTQGALEDTKFVQPLMQPANKAMRSSSIARRRWQWTIPCKLIMAHWLMTVVKHMA